MNIYFKSYIFLKTFKNYGRKSGMASEPEITFALYIFFSVAALFNPIRRFL